MSNWKSRHKKGASPSKSLVFEPTHSMARKFSAARGKCCTFVRCLCGTSSLPALILLSADSFLENTVNTIQQMQQEIASYFLAEKYESLIFVIIGVAAIAFSVWLWTSASSFAATFKAMSYPLVIIGLIQIVVGGTVYWRSDTQIATYSAQVQSAASAYKADEIKRMEVVNKNFTLYKWIEVALLLLAIATTFLVSRNSAWYASAIGLIIQAAVMLVADLFAEHRAYHYLDSINRLIS